MKNIIEITQAVVAFGIHADARRWDALEALFTPTVFADYSEITGIPATPVSATELVAGWKAFLPGFSGTHHLIGTPLTDITGESARAEAEFIATHVIGDLEPSGGNTWTLGGRYQFEFRLVSASWKIEHVKLIKVWQSGNLSLPQEAAKRAQSKAG